MHPGSLLLGAGLGAGLMHFFDRERGRRRRALARDQVIHLAHTAGGALDATARDARNRARGAVATVRHGFGNDHPDDAVLLARVRSKLGGIVGHPGAIEVTAQDGRVVLRGPVRADEVDRLLATVARVRGVVGVDNQLQVQHRAGTVPGLQGTSTRHGPRPELMQRCWSPTARLLSSVGGGALAAYGAARRDLLGAAVGSAGLALLVRGITNTPLERLLGAGAGRHAVEIQKTVAIRAPAEEVFDFWTRYENFPRFMTHVREVRDLGLGQSRWTVAGPTGAPVTWDAVITKCEPNRVLAWKTLPNSIVAHAGYVRFEPADDGGTRLTIRLSYTPPAGALGHGIAALFGTDAKHAMDDDLVRLKSLLETGKATAHGTAVWRDDLRQAS